MITKERLEELISQRAKIYGISKQGNVFCLGLKFRPHTLKNKKWLENKYEVYSKFFETKEDAEFHKEFKRIPRTEYLDLPTWEEFNEMSSFIFESKDRTEMEMAIWFNSQNNDIKTIRITNLNDWNICFFELPLTKENYTIACRKAQELFLGEKK